MNNLGILLESVLQGLTTILARTATTLAAVSLMPSDNVVTTRSTILQVP